MSGFVNQTVVASYSNHGGYVEPELTLYLAGERVVAGFYKRLDAEVTIHLEQEGFLPASLDGQVACYIRLAPVQHQFSTGVAVVKARKSLQEGSNVQEDIGMR
jgi:hypothetical protein